MALRAKVLKKKAEKFELKKLQLLQVTKERAAALEPLLQDVYANHRPKQTDYEVRRDLIRVFNEIAKEIYGHSKDIPVVVEFGSFVMDLFSTSSDLDLSVNFRTSAVTFPRDKKIQTLRKFARKLYALQSKGHVSGVLPITTAKVPIIKCVDRGTGVECDISVENRDGILKSQIIHIISSIDERFKKLSFLMKTWAKAHGINSSKDKTLNSLSIILLVAFHLQTRNPPILPPFSAILKDGKDPATVMKSLSNFANYGQRNRESLAELFITLLIKLSSVEKLWPKGLCASPCTGSWISKTWDSKSKVACISVEDFTDQSQNVARAVGQAEVKLIHKCIDLSLGYIFSFMDGQIGVKVKDLLFKQDGITASIPRGIPKLQQIAALSCVPSQANQTKKVVTGKGKKRGRVMLIESQRLAKKIRTDEGWKGVADGSWAPPHLEARVGSQHVRDWNQACAVWERTEQTCARGLGVTERPSSSVWEVGAGEWTRTQQAGGGGGGGGWGGTHQLSSGGAWGGTQQAGGGWGQRRQTGGGGWEQSQQSGSGGWEQSRQSAGGGWEQSRQSGDGGWGHSRQSGDGGWERSQQSGGGGWEQSRQSGDGGWGQSRQSGSGGWGQSQQSGGGGWEQSQQSGGGGWGQSQQSGGGGWGQSQQSGSGGWGQSRESGGGGWGRSDQYRQRF